MIWDSKLVAYIVYIYTEKKIENRKINAQNWSLSIGLQVLNSTLQVQSHIALYTRRQSVGMNAECRQTNRRLTIKLLKFY